ncbi:MAG: rhomboid family intramembrane serine protease [Pseudomonadales bacterium]|nr:rhomboid family intramembrane serine protease [Pseudomonadales bacterium]
MVEALRVGKGVDLRPLCDQLKGEGLPFRVYETGGAQCLAVADEAAADRVRGLWAAGAGGRRAILPPPGLWPVGLGGAVRTEFQRTPVTLALGALCLLLYPFLGNTAETVGPVLSALLIVPVVPHGNLIAFPSLSATLEAGHLWRLWTPALVHFSVLHLVFNSLWLWEFGRRIEGQEGSGRLLEGLLWLAPASALAQYAVGEHPLFGGLSGVVYGLLGYLVMVQRLRPRRAYRLPPALPVLLIGMLALMATGVTEPFGLAVANGAHLGGLLAGGLWGVARALWPGGGRPRSGA